MTAYEPPADKVQRLVQMGFALNDVKEALRCFKGDEAKAMDLLLDDNSHSNETSHGKKRLKQAKPKEESTHLTTKTTKKDNKN